MNNTKLLWKIQEVTITVSEDNGRHIQESTPETFKQQNSGEFVYVTKTGDNLSAQWLSLMASIAEELTKKHGE